KNTESRSRIGARRSFPSLLLRTQNSSRSSTDYWLRGGGEGGFFVFGWLVEKPKTLKARRTSLSSAGSATKRRFRFGRPSSSLACRRPRKAASPSSPHRDRTVSFLRPPHFPAVSLYPSLSSLCLAIARARPLSEGKFGFARPATQSSWRTRPQTGRGLGSKALTATSDYRKRLSAKTTSFQAPASREGPALSSHEAGFCAQDAGQRKQAHWDVQLGGGSVATGALSDGDRAPHPRRGGSLDKGTSSRQTEPTHRSTAFSLAWLSISETAACYFADLPASTGRQCTGRSSVAKLPFRYVLELRNVVGLWQQSPHTGRRAVTSQVLPDYKALRVALFPSPV
ncbi:MAG: hypothetical protein BJ554DRAFT_6910, partial [Olpidium bornovanus]